MNLKQRIAFERRIVRMVVRQAIDNGLSVTVCDGDDCPVVKSLDFSNIMASVMATDSDTMVLWDAHGDIFGMIWFVYGNDGYDVISDHTDTARMIEFLAPVTAYCVAKELSA